MRLLPFKRQPQKMVKHTEIIRRQPMNCLIVSDHFVELPLKMLKKSIQATDMPTKIIKENNNIYIYHNFNKSLSSFAFPVALKYADALPIFKKR